MNDGLQFDAPAAWANPKANGQAAYTDMVSTMTGWGLLSPPVPAHLVDQLRAINAGWSTDDTIAPEELYFSPTDLVGRLVEYPADLWALAHRGHGMNSYGIGLAVKLGPLVIVQQHAFGGMYMDDRDNARIDTGMRAWSSLLGAARRTRPGPATTAVAFSNYRLEATIFRVGEKAAVLESTENFAPTGWHVERVYDEEFAPADPYEDDSDNSPQAAVAHLSNLVSHDGPQTEYPRWGRNRNR